MEEQDHYLSSLLVCQLNLARSVSADSKYAKSLQKVTQGFFLPTLFCQSEILKYSSVFSVFVAFYPTAIHGCAGIVFILAGWAGGWMGGWAPAATLSGLDLCKHRLEEV